MKSRATENLRAVRKGPFAEHIRADEFPRIEALGLRGCEFCEFRPCVSEGKNNTLPTGGT